MWCGHSFSGSEVRLACARLVSSDARDWLRDPDSCACILSALREFSSEFRSCASVKRLGQD